jgi:hypothetical protein
MMKPLSGRSSNEKLPGWGIPPTALQSHAALDLYLFTIL